jgi:hypothetical protein
MGIWHLSRMLILLRIHHLMSRNYREHRVRSDMLDIVDKALERAKLAVLKFYRPLNDIIVVI